MLSRIVVVAGAVIASGLMGCSSSSSAPGGTTLDPNTMDVRVATPVADPAFLVFLAPEVVIAPGSEHMSCTHLRYDSDDIAFSNFVATQGKFGHHAVLLGAKTPLPPGTVEDCSKAEDMAKYDVFAVPVELPAGYGVSLPKGKALVLQSHYVNTSKNSLLTRDVVTVTRRPIGDVKIWAAPFITNSTSWKIPAQGAGTHMFDCVVPTESDLLFIGGHMHEYGKKITIENGADTSSLAPLYQADWKPEYRDAPPVTLMTAKPLHLTKGSIVRTTCTWQNTLDQELAFPKEMCVSFGYAAGVKETVMCLEAMQ